MTSNRTARFCASDPACLLLPSADAHSLRQALERVDNLSVLCRLCHSSHEVKWSSIESLGLEALFKGIYGDLHASSPATAIAVVERVDGRVAILGATGRPESKQKHYARAWVPSAFIYETHANLASIDHCTKELRASNEACGLLDEEIAEASAKADRSIRIAREHFADRKSARAQQREANGQNKAEFDRQSKDDTEAFRLLRANATSKLKRLQSAHRKVRDRVAWLKQARRDHTAQLKERFHGYRPDMHPIEQQTTL